MADFWVVTYAGIAWLRSRMALKLRPGSQDMPALCRLVAQGATLPARQLSLVQDFAKRVWWRIAIAAMTLFLPVIAIGGVVKPGQWGRNVGTVILVALAAVSAVAICEFLLQFVRQGTTVAYLRKADTGAGDRPLPAYSAGNPRRFDFWLMMFIGLSLLGIVSLIVPRSPH